MVCSFQAAPVVMPVKSGAGIGFAAWRDVAVAGDAHRSDARVARHEGAAEDGECLVLALGVGMMIAAV